MNEDFSKNDLWSKIHDLEFINRKLKYQLKVEKAEKYWLDALATYHRDGQHDEDKKAVDELAEDFREARKQYRQADIYKECEQFLKNKS